MPIVAPPVFPVMSTPPSTNDMENFDTRADTFLGELPAVFRPAVIGIGNSAYANALESQVQATAATSYAGIAGTARDQAQAFAQSAINAPGTSATSASLVAISAGAKSLGTQAGKAWVSGQAIVVADATNPVGLRMYGVITSYDASSGVLAFDVPAGAFVGSGSSNSWVISLTATREGVVRQGAGPSQGANPISIGWGPDARLHASVDGTDLGGLLFDSHGMQLSPPGLFGLFFRTTVPTGWLKANGAAVSRTTYAALFAVIGTYYGPGDGSTTFNLPEMRGIFPRTWDDARGVDAGRAFGSYQAPQNQSHTHGAWSDGAGNHSHGDWTGGGGSHVHGVNDPGHAHSVTTHWGRAGARLGIASGEDIVQGSQATSGSGTGIWLSTDGYHNHQIAADGWHAHAIGVGYEGGGDARPHNVALMGCIKY